MDQPYTQILLGSDLVTEGTSHLDEQMMCLEREIKRVIAVRIYRPLILNQLEEKLQSFNHALATILKKEKKQVTQACPTKTLSHTSRETYNHASTQLNPTETHSHA